MGRSPRIRELIAPQLPLTAFDPGEYLAGLEFYETNEPITDEDRDGLAQFVHFLAFLALKGQSSKWDAATVRRDTSAYRALESHFGQLEGWEELAAHEVGLPYRELAGFLMGHYPPHLPKDEDKR